MSLLSKSEIQYLEGHKKTISKSYEYKLKSIIKKKISILVDKEIPLLSTLFSNLNLTNISKDNQEEGGVEAPKAAQSGQALRPFESQTPGLISNRVYHSNNNIDNAIRV